MVQSMVHRYALIWVIAEALTDEIEAAAAHRESWIHFHDPEIDIIDEIGFVGTKERRLTKKSLKKSHAHTPHVCSMVIL
jgi:hypothetical protein